MTGPAGGQATPALRQGVVTASPTAGSIVTVDVDLGSSGTPVPAGFIGDMPKAGDVVWCLQLPGTTLVVGVATWDPWHTVGASGQPVYGGTWGPVSGSRPLGFRLSSATRRVEFCGAAGAGASTVSNGSTIFTLPAGYRPDLLLRFTISANQAGNTNIPMSVVVQPIGSAAPGAVQATHLGSAGSTVGSLGFEGLSFPLIGAV